MKQYAAAKELRTFVRNAKRYGWHIQLAKPICFDEYQPANDRILVHLAKGSKELISELRTDAGISSQLRSICKDNRELAALAA